MKKICSLILSLLMVFSAFTTVAMAKETTIGNARPKAELLEEYKVAETFPATRDNDDAYDNVSSETIDIDNLIAHSINVKRSGSSYSGSYISDEYDAGLPGYTYQIKFDWKAKVNSVGDYIFENNDIQNARITTHTDHFILAMTWGYYSYSFTKNTYEVASNGRSVTFYTNYEFTVYEKNTAYEHTFSEDHTRKIDIEDLL